MMMSVKTLSRTTLSTPQRNKRMIEWMIEWMVEWMVVWMVEWMVVWLIQPIAFGVTFLQSQISIDDLVF